MLKKVAAIGLVAALALSPLAALAQTDNAAPAAGAAAAPADTSMPAKPMKHKTHKKEEAQRQEDHGTGGARRAGRSSEELISRGCRKPPFAPAPSPDGAVFLCAAFRSPRSRATFAAGGERHGRSGFLVRVRQHLFLSRRHARRSARRSARRRPRLASVPARADFRRPGMAQLAIQHLSRQGALHVARSRADLQPRPACPSGVRSLSRKTACSPRASRTRSRARCAPNSPGASTPRNSAQGCRSPTGQSSRGSSETSASTRRRRSPGRQSEANKARLKAECALAAEIGIFGAPSLVTEDGELFWGDDRLEQGLDWAAAR